MFKIAILSAAAILFVGMFAVVNAQVDTTKPVTVYGMVKAIDGDKLVLETAKGPVTLTIAATAAVKKVPASNPSATAATPSSMSEIAVGDSVVVTALPTADGRLNPARTVLVIAKTDLVAKEKARTDAWRSRGISGVVEAVNPETNQITVKVSGPMGATSNVVISPKPTAKFLKYSSDSIKYTDAKQGTLAGVEKNDSIKALGDKSEDGASFAAEEILTGSYQQVVGTVKSVDAANNEVVVSDLQTKKDVTISLAGTSVMKRFPVQFAERMAGRSAGQGATPGAGGQARQPGGGRPAGMGPGVMGGAGGMGGRANLDDMIERFENVAIADLKVGEMIGVVAAKSDLNSKVKAFKLLAGVEPFVRMAEMAAAGRASGRGQAQVGLQIPGLDGFSMP
nr:hypothetical protein [Blastocatellia bacterium]